MDLITATGTPSIIVTLVLSIISTIFGVLTIVECTSNRRSINLLVAVYTFTLISLLFALQSVGMQSLNEIRMWVQQIGIVVGAVFLYLYSKE